MEQLKIRSRAFGSNMLSNVLSKIDHFPIKLISVFLSINIQHVLIYIVCAQWGTDKQVVVKILYVVNSILYLVSFGIFGVYLVSISRARSSSLETKNGISNTTYDLNSTLQSSVKMNISSPIPIIENDAYGTM